jgi:HK97 gp10 family phage protein
MKFKRGVITSKSLMDKLKNLATNYEHQYKGHLSEAALKVRNEAIRGIRETSRGGLEFRFGPKRVVTVSKPGDAPNTDTGTLLKSIGWAVDEQNLVAEVGTNLKYAKFLELGTQDMEPRPWLMPALERARPALIKIFRKGRGQRKVTG